MIRNHASRRFFFAAFLLFAVWILVQFTGCDVCRPVYVLENGVECRRRAMPFEINGSTTYLDCSDGRNYRDPKNVAYYCEGAQ